MTKIEAIRQAIDTLGLNVSVKEIQEYCSSTLGINISYGYISLEKSRMKGTQQQPTINPRVSLNNLKAFKTMIEKEGGIKELKKILSKAKLLYDLVNEAGGWNNLEQILELLE